MTPEAQRIAIAEACGWAAMHKGLWVESAQTYAALPDYLNDLNAMHEAEAWLKRDDDHAFACYASDFFEENGSDAIHLTAAQRAEAFLRILDLWQE